MNETAKGHEYTFEVSRSPTAASLFSWVVRHRGKVFERSDRFVISEEDARKGAEEAIERARHRR